MPLVVRLTGRMVGARGAVVVLAPGLIASPVVQGRSSQRHTLQHVPVPSHRPSKRNPGVPICHSRLSTQLFPAKPHSHKVA